MAFSRLFGIVAVPAAIVTGLAAGASLTVQALINVQLREFVGTPLRSSFVSYLGGTICCAIMLLATRQSLNIIEPAIRSHWWLWTGGIFGLIYLALAVWLIPRLGSAAVFALVVAGQMAAALIVDHFGLFGVPANRIDIPKLAGAAFLIAGVVLIRR